MRAFFLILLFSSILLPQLAHADAYDGEKEAMRMTKDLLVNPEQRKQAIGSSPDAVSADRNLQSLSGGDSKTTEDLYKFAADIFGSLGQKHGYDADAMDKALQEGLKNPAAFAGALSPAQQQQLHELGLKIEKKQAVH